MIVNMRVLLFTVASVAVQSFQLSSYPYHHKPNAKFKLFVTNTKESIDLQAEVQQRKKKGGEEFRPKSIVVDYEEPFSGEVARKEGEGEFMKDPYESLNIEGSLLRYSIVTVPFIAFAWSDASSNILELLNLGDQGSILLNVMQFIAFKLALLPVFSGIICGLVFAPVKKRSRFVWGVKGIVGGPLAIVQLNKLDELMTPDEVE